MSDEAEATGGGEPAASEEPLTLYLVKRLEMVSRALMDEALRPHGLTALQYTALTALGHRGGLSSAQLARRSFVAPQTMHEMVKWLEQRDLVRRVRDEGNRRALLVSLTPRGREVVDACAPLVDSLEQHVLGAMHAGERAVFRECLERSYAALAPLAGRTSGPAAGTSAGDP